MPTDVQGREPHLLNCIQLKSELDYMAYQGLNTAVYERYRMLPDEDRESHESLDILIAVIQGGIEILRLSPAKTADIRLETEFVEHALGRLIECCSTRNSSPREFFACILAWTEEPASMTNPDGAVRFLDQAEALGVSRYPDLYARLMLKRAEILSAGGRHEDAYLILTKLVEKYYLVPDRNLISSIILMLGKTALMIGKARSYKTLLFSGLRYFYTRDSVRLLFASQLTATYRRSYHIFFDRDRSFADKLLFLFHWFYYHISRHELSAKLRLSKAVRLGVLAYVYFLNYRYREGRPSNEIFRSCSSAGSDAKHVHDDRDGNGIKKRVLVTRAMGGIGDLLMMTPGLHALKQKHPEYEIFFAAPREYHQVFIGNKDVHLIDIENTPIDAKAYRKWFNFTDCPAARVESRTVPDVKANRVDIFARSLGIKGKRLRTMDRRPRYFLTETEREFQRRFWKDHHLEGKRVIGVQLHAAERYKNYPHTLDLVRRLAEDSVVIIFQSVKSPVSYEGNVIDPSPLPLRHAFALAASCDAIIAPDSSFVHFAAAFDIPCVVLSGPIDGKNRIRPYPACRFVDARKVLQCVPCWRNELIPCKLTNMKSSACMDSIEPPEIMAVLEECLRAAGIRHTQLKRSAEK